MESVSKAAKKMADRHTIIARQMYHWYTTDRGTLALHHGLMGQCDICDSSGETMTIGKGVKGR